MWISGIGRFASAVVFMAAAIAITPHAGATEILAGECGPSTKLCIGVRSDARPFSYKARLPGEMSTDQTVGPLRKAHYAGYTIRICDAVLAEMMLPSDEATPLAPGDIGFYDIDKHRQEWIEGGRNKPWPSRFGDLGVKYDILCDPATITNARRDDYIVSPPLFLTGISYISPKGLESPPDACDDLGRWLIGVVGDSSANGEGISTLLKAGELPKYNSVLLAYLKGERDNRGKIKSPCKNDEKGRIREFDTHSQAAAAFCENKIHYYVGDLEIITENVKHIPGCDYANGTRTYTNDRYAIFGRPRSSPDSTSKKERQLFVARFFQVLAQKTVFDPSVLDMAYRDAFRDAPRSRKLQVFYWSIRGGRLNLQ